MFWFNLFGMFWVLSWLEAYNLFVLVSSACIWYFEVGDPNNKPRKVINRSFFRGIRFHMGSLALGSLIVAIIRMAIAVLEYIKLQMESGPGAVTKSDIYKCLITCCEACLVCCLKCVEFLNKHAYIQVIFY